MRPIILTLERFGAFVKKTEIDFSKLSKDGVFLITGETGSGKTTIFDAICYALYGQANGNDREPRNFRSEYADPTKNAYVDLTFDCRGRVYTIHREPPYTKGVVCSDGSVKYNKTETPSVVELHMPNGTVQTGDVVRKTILDVIGLTCEQFRQVVMLAQGEFKKFLLAKSEDKGKVLGTIFGTEKYDRFLELFKSYVSQCKATYLDSLSTLVGVVTSFSYDSTWDYAQTFEEWKKLPQDKKDVQVVLPHLISYVNRLSEERKTLEQSMEEISARVETLTTELKHHESINTAILAYNALTLDLAKLTERQDEIDATKHTLKRLDDAMAIREDYQNCVKAIHKGKELRNQLVSIESSIVSCRDSIESIQTQKDALLSNLPCELTTSDSVLLELNSTVDSLQHKASELSNLATQVDTTINSIFNYEREVRTLQTERAELASRTNKKSNLEKDYSERERLYNLSIAGILAEGLQEGTPCMVCGSVHHPKLAVKLVSAPSKEQLEALKHTLERYQTEYIDYQTSTLLHSERIENLKLNVLESANRVGVSANTISGAKDELVKLKDSISLEVSSILTKVDELNHCIDTLKVLDRQLSDLSYRLNGLTSSKETIVQQLELATTEYMDLKSIYSQSLKSKSIENERTHLELLHRYGEYQSLSSKVRDFERSILDCTSRMSEYSKTIGDNIYMDTTSLREELSTESKQYQRTITRHTEVSYMVKNGTQVCNTVQNGIVDVLDKYQKYMDSDRLYKYANGTITGEAQRVAFNNYVQAYYFDMVLASANDKIELMSSGRYSLIRSNVAKKRSGLDISVFDVYTGTARGASTLSGGETFMASLALALGLSEVVQQLSGGINIDATFIDEGFGTLDSGQSLQHAIETISSLATNGRMVGIISHVSELQECIPNKLQVVKSREGSEILY